MCRTGSVSVLLGNGNGTFQAAVHYSTLDDHAFTVATGDFNGDGKLDLAVGNANCPGFSPLDACDSGSIAVLLGRGNGTFGAAVTYPGGDPWPVDPADTRSSSMATADFNGDGKLDLALSNRNVLLGNGDGTFEPAQSYNPAGDKGVSEVVADFDRDGKPDLAVTTSQSLTILLNIAAGFHQRMPATLSRWFVMPFEHAEDLEAQMRGVALFTLMGFADLAFWAQIHLDIIARFGRFPHRNLILGRLSTREEIAFLAAGGFAG